MDLKRYQDEARKTDQAPLPHENSIVIPLLGLVGEAGNLVAQYKKYLRDGDAHERFREQLSEELGDLLWYMANVASKFGVDLSDVAERNLRKTKERWAILASQESDRHLYDESYPANEQLPRQFSVRFEEVHEGERVQVLLTRDGRQIADRITDNAYRDDGYRFHDVFHFTFAAVLGWSPTTRSFLGCKRKSNPRVDEVEDGGRAGVIEEAIVAFAFDYGRRHRFLDEVHSIDSKLLETIRSMTSQLEVASRSAAEWELAIVEGFRIWRMVRSKRGGYVTVDVVSAGVSYSEPDWEVGQAP